MSTNKHGWLNDWSTERMSDTINIWRPSEKHFECHLEAIGNNDCMSHVTTNIIETSQKHSKHYYIISDVCNHLFDCWI